MAERNEEEERRREEFLIRAATQIERIEPWRRHDLLRLPEEARSGLARLAFTLLGAAEQGVRDLLGRDDRGAVEMVWAMAALIAADGRDLDVATGRVVSPDTAAVEDAISCLEGVTGLSSGFCRHCEDEFAWLGTEPPAKCPLCQGDEPVV